MLHSVYDQKMFYNSRPGRVVRRVLQQRIREFWPDVTGQRVMGCGYATPYLRHFIEHGAERVFAVMPAKQGAHHWPYNTPGDEKNLVCLSDESALPVETASVDRVLIVHSLEFSAHPQQILSEIWRVLKSTGRVLVIVPNRSGFWSHADWSPFGHGTPFSAGQLAGFMREALFVHESTGEALFMPPIRFSLFLKSAGFLENMGKSYFPFAGGVHMVEASKQLYARAEPPPGLKAPAMRPVIKPVGT